MRHFLAALLLILPLTAVRAENIRVVTWNLEWFPGGKPDAPAATQDKQMKAAQEALLSLKPDILLCQEVRDWAAVEKLVSVVPGLKVDMVSNFPERPQNQAIASRFPMDSGWSEEWKKTTSDSPPRGYVFAALQLPDGRTLLTYALHLKSNRDGVAQNIPAREESARQLLDHLDAMIKLYETRGPVAVLIGGDLNTSPDAEFAGDHTIDIIKARGLAWSFEGIPLAQRVSHPGSGKYADANFDHVFTGGFGLHTARVVAVPGVSDHNPVVLDFKTEDKSPFGPKQEGN